jgi:hypothetical protein
MACTTCGQKSVVKYQLINPDGTSQTFDTRADATLARGTGSGKIRPIRVSS